MGNEDAYLLRALEHELRIINKHLPYRRVSLEKLLSMDIPYIVLRDGTRHLIRREELLLLKEIAGDDASRLRIPIILEVNPSFGEGAVVVRDPIAARVVAKILGIEKHSTPLILYRPQLFEIRRVLRTTTTIMYIVG